ncbi:calcium-binding protein [Mesorhizobium sp. IMUNJ 23232]|uniref:calcium-binding protein n=1 Tax=Mesorhizobium sp. IMUNJ 23232 TaxID=3376064 RepID=UPI0037A24CDA
MLISNYIRGDTPEFTLVRNGNEVTATFFYLLNGLDILDPWSGGMYAEVGTYEDSIVQEGEREMNLQIVATLAEDTTTSGSYFIQDHADDVSLERQFTVTLFSSAGNFVGTEKADYVFGSSATDTFRSKGSGDIFEGGGGGDFYRIYSADTKIVEAQGGGSDYLGSAVSYVLAEGVWIESMATTSSSGKAAIDLTGNELYQAITGNAGANTLKDGGGAGDILRGLAGDDTYLIYSAATTVVETSSQGTFDRVLAATDYVLGSGAFVERLATTSSSGTAAIDLTGNALKQEIIGNDGANILDDGGIGGADTLRGMNGNDTYLVFNSGDIIIEASNQGAADHVKTTVDFILGNGVYVENLTTTGYLRAIDLTGNEIAQKIVGNNEVNSIDGQGGSDTIDGKGGSDTLQGGTGSDYFTFSSWLGASNVDTVVDYDVPADTIQLENIVFTALTAVGALAADAFKDTADGPKDADDRIVYNSESGALYYDADGSGSVHGNVKFAVLTGAPEITAADFQVV